MFCAQCGSANADDAKFCASCGKVLETAPPATPIAPPSATPPIAASTPAPPAYGGFVPPPTTSGKAVASLLCGFLFFVFPAAVAAIILGHLSLSDIRKSAGRVRGYGIAVAGLVLGYMGIAIIPLALIVAAILIPTLLRSRVAANESAAIGSLRTIDSAAISYSASYGNGYPRDLDVLSGLGTQNCDHAGLINGDLASGFRNGYIFNYQPTAGDPSRPAPKTAARGCSFPGAGGFTVTADPVRRGTTGGRSFYLDQTGIIRYETDEEATADSAPLE
jgi:type IV pilus assembly protein PilA